MPAYLKDISTDAIRLTALQYNKAPIYSPAKAICSKCLILVTSLKITTLKTA